ncbi:MAG: hypothetical protein ACREK6_00895 [Candidatus Rokuibacteriota bacterium]
MTSAGKRSLESLKTARLLMVLSSMSPLFLLWAIRGNSFVPDRYLLTVCAVMLVLPNLFLGLRIRAAIGANDKREIAIGTAEDHRDHLLVYLFSMLLPFYAAELRNERDVAAVLVALAFIVFLFWHLNLHYMNVLFAAMGYRVFSVSPPPGNNLLSGRSGLVVIARRSVLVAGERLVAYRLSDTVYFER